VTAVRTKVLVVDDEPHIRRILQYLLEQEGYEVHLAGDGEEGLALLDAVRPDLVLLDVMMPRLDGFAVLRSIRASLETSRLPVIMLTAKGESREKVKGLRGGANDYVTKPFNQEELLLRMHNMLDNAQAQREANPLTGLPGNLAIDREAQRRIDSGRPFGFMYLDIDRFKSFNDHYGYSRGDRAIATLAHVLCEAARAEAVPDAFIGHIGGDDFVAICGEDHARQLARRVIAEFDAAVPGLHDPMDLARGFLETRSRAGEVERVALITLTVALIPDAHGRYEHHAELADTLVELKRYGKTKPGSVVVEERRSPGDVGPLLVAADGTETDAPDDWKGEHEPLG